MRQVLWRHDRAANHPRTIWIARAAIAAALVAVITGTLLWVRPAPAADDKPQTREFVLTASEFDWELQPGTTVRAWGYNGQMPGPELRVREGDHVKVTLRNELPVPTTIHWHGVHVPPEMDGPAGLNQAPVEPGGTFTYEFTAGPAGSRMYHSHTDVTTQIALGLYGSLIIEPRHKTTTYDREYTYMLGEWDMELTPDVATGKAPRGPRDSQLRGGELGADLFLMNGHIHEAINPIKVKEGDRVLIRLMNMGAMPHPIHIHGHSFKIVATDGNPVPPDAQLTKDTVLVAPGERYDLELIADNPGVWMVHCHIENHAANGMMTLLEYEGYKPTGPLKDLWDMAPISKEGGAMPGMDMGSESGPAGHGAHGQASSTAPVSATAPASAPATPAAQTPAASTSTNDGAQVVMLDDRFEPRTLTIPAGTTVTFVNKGADWHSVAAFDGSYQSGQIAPGASYSVTFDKPGTYSYICNHHARQGMTGQIIVT
jgi:FtsP/CotA-like multicopper oxidase with cupredoxin domain